MSAAAVLSGQVINAGDYVVARPYRTGIGTSRHFTGRAKVLVVWNETRRECGKLRECTRVTVMCEEKQSHGFQRRDVLTSVIMPEPMKPESVVVVKQRDPNPLTARQMAEQHHPDFDWARYDQLENEAAQAAIEKLNHRQKAPLGRPEPKVEMKIDNRTEIEKMEDNAIQQTGKALIQAQETGIQTKEDMMKAVKVAYSAGRNELTETQVAAVALLCWELGLSPNPGLGHVYGFPSKNGFAVTVGIYGLINLARRDHEFILKDARDMTDEERKQHHLKPNDVGVMVGIIDMREARNAGELAKLGVAVNINDLYHWVPGFWLSEASWDSKENKWKPDNIPSSWTARMVAEKRAVRNALKRLGLNSNVGKLPEIQGYRYDAEEGSYIEENPQVSGGESAPTPEQVEPAIEGVFEELLATQVQAEQERESAVAAQEPVEVAPESAQPEVKAEESAGEVVTPAAPDPDILAVDVGKVLKLYTEAQSDESVKIEKVPTAAEMLKMLKNVVKDLSDNKASDFLKAVRGKESLGGVTSEEWRGLLAVINSKPDLLVIAAMTDKKQQAARVEA